MLTDLRDYLVHNDVAHGFLNVDECVLGCVCARAYMYAGASQRSHAGGGQAAGRLVNRIPSLETRLPATPAQCLENQWGRSTGQQAGWPTGQLASRCPT